MNKASVVEIKDIKKRLEEAVSAVPEYEGTHNIFPSILKDIERLQQKLDYVKQKVEYAERKAAKAKKGEVKPSKAEVARMDAKANLQEKADAQARKSEDKAS